MPRPIVIAHHLIWTVYGAWLPNDPRGSMSSAIRNPVLEELGSLHFGRKKIQPVSSDLRSFIREAAKRLEHPVVELDRRQVEVLANCFAEVIGEHRYTCYACTIMPDHVHLLIRKHKHLAEEMIANFQIPSRLRLRELGNRSFTHPVWGGPGWKVFLDHPDEIRRTITYIENNPVKLRQPVQRWRFVKPYDGWPLHPGRSPDSPYAKRLRRP